MKKKILIVDDNEKMCNVLKKYLEKSGEYLCDVAQTGEQVIKLITTTRYKLITLDIEMGEENGLDLIDEINNFYQVPIIYISCRRDINSKIIGLKKGAIDFITKPFDLEEIYLRITNLTNRIDKLDNMFVDDYEVDLTRRIIYKNGKRLMIEKVPAEILIVLLSNPNTALSRETVSDYVWADKKKCDSRAIDKNISIVRRVTRDHKIKTVRGVGYIYEAEAD